ncbi:hypothetical protein VB151_19010 [Xanthomonas fragariae]|nr:hypothetical protein [Xanthomonas fragariae]ENZ94834.1 hypothetical protein O1K_12881 [Xanthomonas fragariae LMG 25863]AOD14630.1 hypothetical protein BER92_07635 [Xanthomonas fragariae]AOD18026.1 hypothetical protein BER93_07660 [Xanthomonas fragariae]MBL9220520.1 hypothetical protein [Xanthomonas fragariae]MDM7556311.1 hypothetical protein [Xanthomonas fragariae]
MASDHDEAPSFAQVQEWTNIMRNELMEITERHMREGLRIPVPIASYVFLELGTRLALIGHGLDAGPAMARKHVEAVLALIEADDQSTN